MNTVKALFCIILVAVLQACATNKTLENGFDFSHYKANEPEKGLGLWYGSNVCRADHSTEGDVLVGIERAGTDTYKLRLVKRTGRIKTTTFHTKTLTVKPDANGTVQFAYPRKQPQSAISFIYLENINSEKNLRALILQYKPNDVQRYIKRCKTNELKRVDTGSEGPLLENWGLLSTAEYVRRKTYIGDRGDLVGTWVGSAICSTGLKPTSLKLELDRSAGWRATFTLDRQSQTLEMRPISSAFDEAHGFFALDPAQKPLVRGFNGRSLAELDGTVRWLSLSIPGCRDSLLYRHWQLPGLGGSYAAATSFNDFCIAVRNDWTGEVSSRITEFKALKQQYGRLFPFGFTPVAVARAPVLDGSRFKAMFGVDIKNIPSDSYELLTYQLATCAVLGPAFVRGDIDAGLFPSGSTRYFKPGDRTYRLFLSQHQFAEEHHKHRKHPASLDAIERQLLKRQSISELNTSLKVLSSDIRALSPAALRQLAPKLANHKKGLEQAALEAERNRIALQGPPKIDQTILQGALHRQLKRASRISDRALAPAMRLPPGFAYSCGETAYCEAMGGIISYRYYVISIEKCNQSGDRARCQFRMGLSVRSNLSNSASLGNQFLGSMGAMGGQTVVESVLAFDDLHWDIVNGINPVQ